MNWSIIEKEIEIKTARSGGAGGQHVNKVESKVELSWILHESAGLDREEKRRLKHHLGRRLDTKGRLRVVDQSDRSQHKNRQRALGRLKQLITENLRPIPKKRKATSFVANSKKRRAWKEKQSEKKAARRKPDW